MSDPLTAPDDTANTVAVWDLPVRLCHWGFALLIPAMWWTADNSIWGWHKRLGLVLLGVLAFRICWGFIGPHTARFAQFLRGPKVVLAYFRGDLTERAHRIGHNPAGGWSAAALLAAMLFQVSLGLFSGDPYDGATGPLNALVGVMTADWITDLHEQFVWVVIGLVGLHLSAVAFYEFVKRERIVKPMITGRSEAEDGGEGIGQAGLAKTGFCIVLSGALVFWIANGAPPLK